MTEKAHPHGAAPGQVKRPRHPIARRLDGVELAEHPQGPGFRNRPGQLRHGRPDHCRLLQRMTAAHQLSKGGLHTNHRSSSRHVPASSQSAAQRSTAFAGLQHRESKRHPAGRFGDHQGLQIVTPVLIIDAATQWLTPAARRPPDRVAGAGEAQCHPIHLPCSADRRRKSRP